MSRSPERGRRGTAPVRIATDAFQTSRVRKSLVRILDESPLCALATIGAGGRPRINTAYFAYSADFDFFFLSASSSAHVRNLRRDRRAALAVFRSPQVWGGNDRGVQLFGTCKETRGTTTTRAHQIYASRFPAYVRWLSGAGASEEQSALLKSYRFYRFRPRRFKILDEREFGGAVFVEGAFRRRR